MTDETDPRLETIDNPPGYAFVMQIVADVAPGRPVGATPQGQRVLIPITGGAFRGPKLRGRVLEGADRLVVRPDGVTVIDALYELETDDGAIITIRNRAPMTAPAEGRLPRSTVTFIAPEGPYDWLNRAVFVGTLLPTPERGYVRVRVDQAI